MNKEEKLRSLLENVKGSYSDFVYGGLVTARNHNAYDKMISFIESNPDATTSDIVLFDTEEILGIKPVDAAE
jgi:hypothetical protein